MKYCNKSSITLIVITYINLLNVAKSSNSSENTVLQPSGYSNSRCGNKLGLENGLVGDSSITASESVSPKSEWGPHNARLNRGSAWVALGKANQWLQVLCTDVMLSMVKISHSFTNR